MNEDSEGESMSFVICTLRPGKVDQVQLDQQFTDAVRFSIQGAVHPCPKALSAMDLATMVPPQNTCLPRLHSGTSMTVALCLSCRIICTAY